VSTLGVVLVPVGEACAGALLGGTTLLDRAVATLRSCPDVDDVLVLVPGEPPPDAARAGVDLVVLHDLSFPLVDASTVGAVLDALRADPGAAAAVAVLPVTDTLKQVAADGAVLGTVDRDGLRVAGSPQAYRPHLVPVAVPGPSGPSPLRPDPPDAAALPRALADAGLRVVLVEAPPAAFRVRTELDLLAVRALLGEDV
jgi:2-C-methyl-D-erythritol 4-phosphate cytidylyltransferase/2-C-methyl-D-erythritol 2,4-cyclodiphosphate synthase